MALSMMWKVLYISGLEEYENLGGRGMIFRDMNVHE